MTTNNELTISCVPTEVSGCDDDENHIIQDAPGGTTSGRDHKKHARSTIQNNNGAASFLSPLTESHGGDAYYGIIQNDRTTTQGKGVAGTSEWICRLCGQKDSVISVKLTKVPNFCFLRSHCSKDMNEVNLAKHMRYHAAEKNHMPMWNFANTNLFLEKRSESGASNVDMIVEYALVKSSAKYTYSDFIDLVPSPITDQELHVYVALRFGGCRRMLEGNLLDQVDAKIRKIAKWKAMRKEHHVSLWPRLRLHFRAMQRAINANWETITKTDLLTLYQLIQDVFVGNHYGPSLMYMPLERKGRDCDSNSLLASPFRVVVRGDDPFMPKPT